MPYAFCSEPFAVTVWNGVGIANVTAGSGTLGFDVADIAYPRSYEGSPFPFVSDNGEPRICDQCSFRPWAQRGWFQRAELEVTRAGGAKETLAATCNAQGKACKVNVNLASGDQARIRAYDQDGNTGTHELVR